MKKSMTLFGVIVFLMLILPLLAGVASAEAIIIHLRRMEDQYASLGG